MVKKHERSSVVSVIGDQMLYDFVSDAVKAITKLDRLYKNLSSFEEGEIDEDEIYDVLDEFQMKTDVIQSLSVSHPSVDDALNKYLRNVGVTTKMFVENVKSIADRGVYPTLGDAGILKDEIYYVIGGLSYFIVCDFDLIKSVEDFVETGDCDLDEIIDSYLKSARTSLDKFGQWVLGKFKDYKFRLDFFDNYPEYEESFEKAAGPGYNLIPEGALTIEIVKQVIDGDLTIDELLESLEE